MAEASFDPERFVGLIGILLIAGFFFYRFVVWLRDAPTSPDPWSSEIADGLDQADAAPVCHKCLDPQPPGQWFCEHCGTAVGEYNNWMPYVYLFSIGEVLRNGTTDHLRLNVLTVGGYLFFSFATFVMMLPALILVLPIYWYSLFTNFRRIGRGQRTGSGFNTAG